MKLTASGRELDYESPSSVAFLAGLSVFFAENLSGPRAQTFTFQFNLSRNGLSAMTRVNSGTFSQFLYSALLCHFNVFASSPWRHR